MQLNWRNIFIAIILIFALIYLPAIVHNVSMVVSSFAGAFSGAFSRYSGSHNSQTYDLARLCVLLIFVLGVLKLITRRR
jgi:hypothetical protein